MNGYESVVGIRQANHGSGVGLFNRLLAEHLGVPYLQLDEYAFRPGRHSLLSLKFGELDAVTEAKLRHGINTLQKSQDISLFLHTLDRTELEHQALETAAHVFCGNDLIYRALQPRVSPLTRVFAPSLISERFDQMCRPAEVQCFYFGMASKVDRARFSRLRDLLDEAGSDFKFLCSLSNHQTSEAACLDQTVAFFTQCFGDRFVYLGTLTDMGIAYFLNTSDVFVGFYTGGVKANNTTFNTALRFHKKIISNLDRHSPEEVRGYPFILDIDSADVGQLSHFMLAGMGDVARATSPFTWDELIRRLGEPWRSGAMGRAA